MEAPASAPHFATGTSGWAIIEEHNKRMSQELEMARQIQRALIPQPDFDAPGFDIAFEYKPATEVA